VPVAPACRERERQEEGRSAVPHRLRIVRVGRDGKRPD